MNRRILVLTIALSVTALLVAGYGQAVGYAAFGPAGVPVVATVTAYGLNVRTGPGVDYPIIGVLSQGVTVEVVGKNATSDWLQILYPSTGSGQRPASTEGRGWVAAAYVDLSGSLAEVPEVSALSSPTAAMESGPTPVPELTGKLVFQVCNGCDIYVINANGSGLRRLTDGLDPAWSPDGKKVAFARWQDPRGIYVIDEDGRNETLVFGWSQAKTPVWSPDGRYIAFTRRYGGREVDKEYSFPGFQWVSPANPWWKLGLVRVEDRYFTDLPCYDHSFSPTWSPDGKAIAYQSDFGLHLVTRRQGHRLPKRFRPPPDQPRWVLRRSDLWPPHQCPLHGHPRHLAGLVTRRQQSRLHVQPARPLGDLCHERRRGEPGAADPRGAFCRTATSQRFSGLVA